MIKRIFDLIIACVMLIMISPILLGLMLWIRCDSPGPAFYLQKRTGRHCSIFKIYKLRTMTVGADRMGGFVTQPNDPRVTTAGAVLRRTSLDELPQLINVVLGDMSLVGPRPDTPSQEENYLPEDWRKRHSIRPGITGLAQARLRSSATFEERLEFDLFYVNKSSFSLDLKILFETINTLFHRRVV